MRPGVIDGAISISAVQVSYYIYFLSKICLLHITSLEQSVPCFECSVVFLSQTLAKSTLTICVCINTSILDIVTYVLSLLIRFYVLMFGVFMFILTVVMLC